MTIPITQTLFYNLDMGVTLGGVQTQVSDLLGNAVIVGLVAACIALLVIPRILHVAKGAFGRH